MNIIAVLGTTDDVTASMIKDYDERGAVKVLTSGFM